MPRRTRRELKRPGATVSISMPGDLLVEIESMREPSETRSQVYQAILREGIAALKAKYAPAAEAPQGAPQ